MANKRVTTPAGETIEIVPDADWAAMSGISERALAMWYGSKPLLIRTLWEQGTFTNPSGQVMQELHKAIQTRFPNSGLTKNSASMNGIFNDSSNALAFQRDINGRRTYSIKLVAIPEAWYRKLQRDIRASHPSVNGTKKEETETVRVPIEELRQQIDEPQVTNWDESEVISKASELIDELEDFAPALDVQIANQVALSLLTTVVEIIQAGPTNPSQLHRLETDLEHSRRLLSQRLEENESLRKRLREVGDELHATKVERDALRSRLRATERNLTEALKGETAQAVNAEIHKRVDQIMRTKPTTTKGDD